MIYFGTLFQLSVALRVLLQRNASILIRSEIVRLAQEGHVTKLRQKSKVRMQVEGSMYIREAITRIRTDQAGLHDDSTTRRYRVQDQARFEARSWQLRGQEDAGCNVFGDVKNLSPGLREHHGVPPFATL